jgi:hypothetical protein
MNRQLTNQQLLRHPAQSERRVRGGAKLVAAALLIGAAAGALGVWWPVRVCGAAATFFVLGRLTSRRAVG